ncbi:ExbD/TolR family protein [Spiribacter halobius]|uniref:Biopolymer transporter ExbD n=1 Tax=Sediminicurvatus halobius TaxID=2182432 RepID=A0A2U2N255_9GAMM|nr:biopolymer transporter ExbD [Spiribacter halobius]PWG63276.1 biopolymer transporter ExbD [Spiribacter halobius]UEX76650.1 biopolymer transporter ExbD [Spiribacter halobius]
MSVSRPRAHRPFRIERPQRPARALISLTPLIDVVFILLVFFLLASSFLDWRAVTLQPAAGGGNDSAVAALLVEVRTGDLRLGGRVVDRRALIATVTRQVAGSPDRRILVRPAAGVPLQRTVDVLDDLRRAGARRLALIDGGQETPP